MSNKHDPEDKAQFHNKQERSVDSLLVLLDTLKFKYAGTTDINYGDVVRYVNRVLHHE